MFEELFYWNYFISAKSFLTYGMSVYAMGGQGEGNTAAATPSSAPGKKTLQGPEKTVSSLLQPFAEIYSKLTLSWFGGPTTYEQLDSSLTWLAPENSLHALVLLQKAKESSVHVGNRENHLRSALLIQTKMFTLILSTFFKTKW